MTFDCETVKQQNSLFIQVLQAAIAQTPADWKEGVLVIHKQGDGVVCELSNPATGRSLPVTEEVFQCAQEFAYFQRTDNWRNDWIKVTTNYSFCDPSVDYTATREFTYAEDIPTRTGSEDLPDAEFWRRETANEAWQ